MRLYPEKFGNNGGNGRKKSSVSNAVDCGKKVNHPQLVCKLQPQKRGDKQYKTTDHYPSAADAVNSEAAEKATCHAHTANG